MEIFKVFSKSSTNLNIMWDLLLSGESKTINSFIITDSESGLNHIKKIIKTMIEKKEILKKTKSFLCSLVSSKGELSIIKEKKQLPILIELTELLGFLTFINELGLKFMTPIALSEWALFFSFMHQPPFITKLLLSFPVQMKANEAHKILDKSYKLSLDLVFPHLKELAIEITAGDFETAVNYMSSFLPKVESLILSFPGKNLKVDSSSFTKLLEIFLRNDLLQSLNLSFNEKTEFYIPFNQILEKTLRVLKSKQKTILISLMIPFFVETYPSTIPWQLTHLEHLSLSLYVNTELELHSFIANIIPSSIKTLTLNIEGLSNIPLIYFENFKQLFDLKNFYWLKVNLNEKNFRPPILWPDFLEQLKIEPSEVQRLKVRNTSGVLKVIIKGPDNIKRGFCFEGINGNSCLDDFFNCFFESLTMNSNQSLRRLDLDLFYEGQTDFIKLITNQTKLVKLRLGIKSTAAHNFLITDLVPYVVSQRNLVKLCLIAKKENNFLLNFLIAFRQFPFLNEITLGYNDGAQFVEPVPLNQSIKYINKKKKRMILIARVLRANFTRKSIWLRKEKVSQILEWIGA